MITLLSSAKTLDESTPIPTKKSSTPRLLEHSEKLVDVLREKSVADLQQLMSISTELATMNVERFRGFQTPFDSSNARQAMYLFNGDVYQGLDAYERFDERDVTEATKTLRILSGLYGLLRPTDLIQPYRLEMGTKLATPRGKDLYAFWGDVISELLASDLQESPGDAAVINLASNEYFDVVNTDLLEAPTISPRFEDENPKGDFKVLAFFAKKARGDMAGWIVRNRIRKARDLANYDGLGYQFVPDASTDERPVFRRARPAK